MKKFLLTLGLVIICFVLFVLLFRFWFYSEIEKDTSYWAGRDTILFLGDGRFQIGESLSRYSISDEESSLSIETDVYRYYHDWEMKILYSEGQYGYTVINYETGYVQQYKELEEFDIDIQEIFNTKPFMTLKNKQ